MTSRKATGSKKSQAPAPAGKQSSTASLAGIVGDDVYNVWVEMLSHLGRNGRSHRLFVVVASMLQHAACVAHDAQKRRRKSATMADETLLDALTEPEPGGENEELASVVMKLFKDARVPYVRTNRGGDDYSLVDGSIEEFVRWFNMPWEE